MNSYRAIGRLLFVVLAPALVVSLVSIAVAQAGPQRPGGHPSGIPDWGSVAPADKGRVIAPEGTHGTEGGVDVSLGGTNEPAITVNPLNGNNIAMASLFQLRVSTTNGASFSAPTTAPVPATHNRCGDASLAFDSQGRLFCASRGCVPSTPPRADEFIAQANPTTGAVLAGYPVNVTASPMINLPAASGFSHDKEWLAADHVPGSASPFPDRLHIVWTQFLSGGATAVLTTFSTDQGQTWSAPVTLSAAGEGFV